MTFDLAVIGAGSGGLSVAAAAAQFGRKVVLFEKAKMGGDCLNYGCVPSKALIAAAKQVHAVRGASRFGITSGEPKIDFAKVMAHVTGVIAAIAPHDSRERFEGLGVTVVQSEAKFRDGQSVEADGVVYRARRFVIASGSRPALPPIPGLAEVPYLTNESLFDLAELPRHLVVIGGGPIGLEMAQAFRRLGAAVTVIEALKPLGREDPELAAIALAAARAEGVDIREGHAVKAVRRNEGGIAAELEGGAVEGTHLLVATGRKPTIEGLDLEAARIAFTAKGITVDRGLRTTNRRVYAVGDVAGGPQFTHAAGHQAGLVIRNALFGLPVRFRAEQVPRVTFTDPELAQAGLTEAEARERRGGNLQVLRRPYSDNDRARAEGFGTGLIKVVAGKGGKILGVGIVGAQAGELIQPWLLAMGNGLTLKAMAGCLLPYPTLGEINRRVAIDYFSPLATNPWVRRVIGMVSGFG